MTTTHFILIVLIPLVIGGVILYFVFRNVNRKYCVLFEKFIEAARKNPEGIKSMIKSEDAAFKQSVVEEMAALEHITKIEILKAGRKVSQIRIHALASGAENIYFAEISCIDADWGITQFRRI